MAINKSWLNPANPPALSAANYPALKNLWQCNQSDIGGLWLTDAMGRNNLYLAAAQASGLPKIQTPAAPDDFSVYPYTNQAGSSMLGASPRFVQAPGTKNCVLVVVGKFTTAGFMLGEPIDLGLNNYGGIVASQPQTTSIYDGTNTLDAAAAAFTSTADITGRAVAIDFTNGVQRNFQTDTALNANTTMSTVALSSATPAAITALNTIENDWACVAACTNLYTAQWWIFSGPLPTDIPAMLAWTAAAASTGNKNPYPAWAGKT